MKVVAVVVISLVTVYPGALYSQLYMYSYDCQNKNLLNVLSGDKCLSWD